MTSTCGSDSGSMVTFNGGGREEEEEEEEGGGGGD